MKNQRWKWWLVSAALLCLRLAAFATQPNNEKKCDDSLGIVFVSPYYLGWLPALYRIPRHRLAPSSENKWSA
jgi:hypothetical protein